MSQAPDYFSDMLLPGEALVATLGGPGPAVETRQGPERSWYQVGLTAGRFLLVKMVQGPRGGDYQPVSRLAVGREFIRISRFPRTPVSAARLDIQGCGEPFSVVDIDSPQVFPYVEPFLAVWGGSVGGAGTVAERAPEIDYNGPAHENKKLLVVALVGVLLLMTCCGCAGLGVVIKTWVLPAL